MGKPCEAAIACCDFRQTWPSVLLELYTCCYHGYVELWCGVLIGFLTVLPVLCGGTARWALGNDSCLCLFSTFFGPWFSTFFRPLRESTLMN